MSNAQLVAIHDNLTKLIDHNAKAMPQGFNQTRFIQNCMTVLQETKGITVCKPISVARTLLKGAFLGLDFFNKECYAIVYKGTVEFQTDYKGEVKLAKKYSINPIKDIYAKVVREGDEFSEEIIAGKQSVHFKPKPFNDGEIIGAFAVVMFEDGSMNYDTMSKKEIENIKENFSRKSNQTGEYSKAWRITPGEMYRKTVLRRLCKNVELNFDTIEQTQAFEDSADMDFEQEVKSQQKNPLNEIYEAEFEVLEDDETETDESDAVN